MLSLRAVQPHRIRIRDWDREGWRVGIGGLHRHVARVDSCGVACVLERDTGRVEGGLYDGVVANAELELHHVADVCGQVGGCEGQRIGGRAGDFDDVDFYVLGWGGLARFDMRWQRTRERG
jgi:hypothetical protein